MDTLTLLTMPHEHVRQLWVQEALVPGVSVSDLDLGVPSFETGTAANFPIFVSGEAYEKPNWPYYGSETFGYNRADLGEAMGHLDLWFKLPLPVSSVDVGMLLGEVLGVKFEEGDLVDEVLTQDTFSAVHLLKAAPNSPRWIGQVPIRLYRGVPR